MFSFKKIHLIPFIAVFLSISIGALVAAQSKYSSRPGPGLSVIPKPPKAPNLEPKGMQVVEYPSGKVETPVEPTQTPIEKPSKRVLTPIEIEEKPGPPVVGRVVMPKKAPSS